MPFCGGGRSAAGEVVAVQQARLVSKHERQRVGAAALKSSGHDGLVAQKRVGVGNKDLGALGVAMLGCKVKRSGFAGLGV